MTKSNTELSDCFSGLHEQVALRIWKDTMACGDLTYYRVFLFRDGRAEGDGLATLLAPSHQLLDVEVNADCRPEVCI